jgi:hypothetical protein
MSVTNSSEKREKPTSRASAPRLRRESDGIPMKVEFGSDSSTGITSLRTPAPLPPSPAGQDAEGWFEQAPTNPAAIPDLGALAAGGTDSDSVPGWALPSVVALEKERKSVARVIPEKTMYRWLLPLLLAATCLAVGMLMGALLQERLGAPRPGVHPVCPDPSAHSEP